MAGGHHSNPVRLIYAKECKCLVTDLRPAFSIPELTGLEPATSAVTGRRSNQLSYNSSEKAVKLELNLRGFNRKFLRIKHGRDERTSRSTSLPTYYYRAGSDERELLPTEGVFSWFSFMSSATARSICRSRPSATLLGSFITWISGSTCVLSM
jgi:hypothetical protein